MSREAISYSYGYRPLAMTTYAAMAMAAFTVGSAWAQDTQLNTSGNPPLNQNQADALPPPTPPSQDAASANQASSQPELANDPRALEASRNAAYSTQQPNQDQSLLPPQPPTDGAVNQQAVGGRAQLGIHMIASEGPGVRVTGVSPGSAAETAGVRSGDFLLAVGNQNVEMPNAVANIIQRHKPGDSVQLRLWRDGSEQLVTANLQEMRPAPTQTTVNRPIYSDGPVYYENNVVGGYAPRRVYRDYYYPGNYGYYGYGYPSGYRYGWGGPYRGSYYGTPRFGYWNSPWGEGVNIGGFQFGWR